MLRDGSWRDQHGSLYFLLLFLDLLVDWLDCLQLCSYTSFAEIGSFILAVLLMLNSQTFWQYSLLPKYWLRNLGSRSPYILKVWGLKNTALSFFLRMDMGRVGWPIFLTTDWEESFNQCWLLANPGCCPRWTLFLSYCYIRNDEEIISMCVVFFYFFWFYCWMLVRFFKTVNLKNNNNLI